MLLHGNYIKITSDNNNDIDSNNFIFWGEKDSALSKKTKQASKKLFSAYPGLISANELVQTLSCITKDEMVLKKNVSAGIICTEPDIIKEIKGVVYGPSYTINLLLSLDNKASIIPELEISPDLIYWILCTKFALELIVKHRYYPETELDKNGFLSSYWNMVADKNEDKERFRILKEGMPPSVRSVFPLVSSVKKSINSNAKADSIDSIEGIDNTASINLQSKAHDAVYGLLHSYGFPKQDEILKSFINWVINNVVKNVKLEKDEIELVNALKYKDEKIWISTIVDYGVSFKSDRDKKLSNTIYKGLKEWSSTLATSLIEQPLRTCFKITPPEGKDDKWQLDYLLQARDDQSLLMHAKDVWEKPKDISNFLKKVFENPQERLLKDLSIASRVFEPILKSLYSAAPIGCLLTKEQAYQFLKEGAILLEENGFGIIAPPWWKKPTNINLNLKIKPKRKSAGTVSKGILGLDTILEYDWKAAIGDTVLSEEDFKKLSKLKIPLIKVRGEWVQLDEKQIKNLAEFWHEKDKIDNNIKLADILRIRLGGSEEFANGIKISSIKCDNELGDFILNLSNSKEKFTELPPPKKLNGELRPYQKRGFSWLEFLKEKGIGACLADDMGLGKTVQLISLELFEREKNKKNAPSLLICPTSVTGNWIKELEKFAPSLKVMLHHGQTRKTGRLFTEEALRYDIVISTYSLIYRDEEEFKNVEWECIVLDEAQYIKNPSSLQTQAVKRLKTHYRVALTGTPLENRLLELWSIMDFLNPGYLGNSTYFKTNYAVPIEKYNDAKKAEKLKSIISPFVLRRLKTDPNIIKDLPEKIETKVYCRLTKEQATLYEAVVENMLEKIENSEGIERKGIILATFTKLKQICNHPTQFLKDESSLEKRSGKLERLFELTEEIIAEENKVLIFTQFAEMGQLLKNAVKKQFKFEPYFLYGGVQRNSREKMIDCFQNDKKAPPVFILSLKAGGVGLNLTEASHVIHYDRWWNPAVENQATDRAFRIGQKKNVQVHKFICSGTLEERIDKMLETKKELAESIIGSGESWLTEMTTQELGNLLKLNYNAAIIDDV